MSHGPTWTLEGPPEIGMDGHLIDGPRLKPGERVVVARPEDIRSQVCQELAEALRERGNPDEPGPLHETERACRFAAEFVEQFGTDRGGEDG